jgi:hypothetical protein
VITRHDCLLDDRMFLEANSQPFHRGETTKVAGATVDVRHGSITERGESKM